MQRLQSLLIVFSSLGVAALVLLFLYRNQPAFAQPGLFAALGLGYFLFYGAAVSACLRATLQPGGSTKLWQRLLLLFAAVILVYLFLDNTVLNYFQPVSLFDDVIAAWALAWGSLALCLLIGALLPSSSEQHRPVSLLAIALLAVLGIPLVAALENANELPANPTLASHQDLFIGGEDGYRIYRIPALLVLPAGSTLAGGGNLAADRILAFSEARRDGALDTGAIDLVMKLSDDGGDSWSQQKLVCRHESDGQRGKCGNATPIFDQQTGQVHLAYNLSGISAGRQHSAHIVTSDDGGKNWSKANQVANDNLVFGPGHGIQKQLPPHAGRLLLPAYLDQAAIALYSDDAGNQWHRSEPLDTGNETELAELSDGSIYLTTRHRAPIGRPPDPNGRLYSLSLDGGDSWNPTRIDTALITPICQASVLRYGNNGGLLFSNPAHHNARVNMTLRYSADDGKTWQETIEIYPGASGYSELASLSNGDILLLYERGKLAYSERISLARLPGDQLDRPGTEQ